MDITITATGKTVGEAIEKLLIAQKAFQFYGFRETTDEQTTDFFSPDECKLRHWKFEHAGLNIVVSNGVKKAVELELNQVWKHSDYPAVEWTVIRLTNRTVRMQSHPKQTLLPDGVTEMWRRDFYGDGHENWQLLR